MNTTEMQAIIERTVSAGGVCFESRDPDRTTSKQLSIKWDATIILDAALIREVLTAIGQETVKELADLGVNTISSIEIDSMKPDVTRILVHHNVNKR